MSDLSEIVIPVELKDTKLPFPDEITYWELRAKRTYWIDFEIGEDYSLIELAKEIVRLNIEDKDVEDPKPITLYIHSYGGDLRQAIFFCDLIESSHVPIITVATGAAMSAGLLIFLAGKRRYAFNHSQVLIHQGSGASSGSYEEMDAAQKAYKREIDRMKDFILSHTTIYESTYEKHKKGDWYLTGKDLIKFGVADKIISSFNEIQ